MSAPFQKEVNREEQLMRSLYQRGISLFRPTCLQQLGVLSHISPTTFSFCARIQQTFFFYQICYFSWTVLLLENMTLIINLLVIEISY